MRVRNGVRSCVPTGGGGGLQPFPFPSRDSAENERGDGAPHSGEGGGGLPTEKERGGGAEGGQSSGAEGGGYDGELRSQHFPQQMWVVCGEGGLEADETGQTETGQSETGAAGVEVARGCPTPLTLNHKP